MRELFFYLLQFYAHAYGIRIHAVVLMSTHYHLLFTDVRGVMGDFFQAFHAMLAKAVQVYRGTKSVLFIGSALTRGPLQTDKRPTSQPDNVTATACVEAMAYIICNPTEAGIVETRRSGRGSSRA